MQAWLAKLATLILWELLPKLVALISEKTKAAIEKVKRKKKGTEAAVKLEAAQTKEEFDEAADNIP